MRLGSIYTVMAYSDEALITLSSPLAIWLPTHNPYQCEGKPSVCEHRLGHTLNLSSKSNFSLLTGQRIASNALTSVGTQSQLIFGFNDQILNPLQNRNQNSQTLIYIVKKNIQYYIQLASLLSESSSICKLWPQLNLTNGMIPLLIMNIEYSTKVKVNELECKLYFVLNIFGKSV